jgi:hypothetical protein
MKRYGVVVPPVRAILRLEALLLFAALIAAYWLLRGNWVVFVVLLLSPDLAMLPYLRSARIGAWSYNAFHTLVGPIVLGACSVFVHALAPFAVIWAAHIAMDRACGFGLKYDDGFDHTHLGMVGKSGKRRQ